MSRGSDWPASNSSIRNPNDIVYDWGDTMKDKEFITCLVVIFVLAFAIFVCLAYLL